jgi:MFS family permease
MSKDQAKKAVRTFALASFLNDFGSDMIYPIWPIFVRALLGSDMAVLGFIDGLGEAVVSISQAASGYVSDKIRKRKIFVWIGYLFGSASRIGYSLSTAWQHLIPFRILDRAGKMRGAPRDAMIADESTRENRGRNFGLLRAMDNLGAVCGIIVCTSVLYLGLLDYRKLFFLASIPSILGALLILLLIKEKRLALGQIYKGLSLKDLDWNFRLFLSLSAFFALGSFSYSFLLLIAEHIGFGVQYLPLLYLLFTVVASLVSLPFGKLSDRIGRRFVLMLSYVLWGLVSLTLILIQSYWAVVLCFVFYGLHKGALDPVQRALVSELAPRNYKASSLGGFQLVVGLCALPSSLITGLLWDQTKSFVTPLYLSLCLTLLALLMLLFIKEKQTLNAKNQGAKAFIKAQNLVWQYFKG